MIIDLKLGRLLLPLAIILGLPSHADAKVALSADHEGRLGQCIRQAAGGRAWLEKTLWGLRDQEGGWIGAQVANTNGTYDLGPLQVNSSWVPKLASLVGRSPVQVHAWLVADPCFNVQAARWIFLSGLRMTGNYWKAIGVYHSPAEWRQRRYAADVALRLRRRFGDAAFSL